MLELKRTPNGYEATVGDEYRFSLPSDAALKKAAIDACIRDVSSDGPALSILRNCELSLEVVPGKDAMERLLGVVITVDQEDAETLERHDDVFVDVMSAIGLACGHIETDRVAIRDRPIG